MTDFITLSDWWTDLSPEAQQRYLEQHPRSELNLEPRDVEDPGTPIDEIPNYPEIQIEDLRPGLEVETEIVDPETLDQQFDSQDQPFVDRIEQQIDEDPELQEQEELVDQALNGNKQDREKLTNAINLLLFLSVAALAATAPALVPNATGIAYMLANGWLDYLNERDKDKERNSDRDVMEDEQEHQRRGQDIARDATLPDGEDRLADHGLELTDLGLDRDGNPVNQESRSSVGKRRAGKLIAQSVTIACRKRGLI